MKFVGLTGLIGAGKSTVGARLAGRGALVIDVDAVSRELQEPGQPFFEQIVDRWGRGVVRADGRLDRAALAAIVFHDPEQLAELTAMAAPLTEAELVRRASTLIGTGGIAVAEAAMYLHPMYGMSGLIVVDVAPEVAARRLVEQRGMAPDDAAARIASQRPRRERLEHADFVIDNSGSLAELDPQVAQAWEWIHQQPDSSPVLDRAPASRRPAPAPTHAPGDAAVSSPAAGAGPARFPRIHAQQRPDVPAIIMGQGRSVSYAQLEEGANRVAHVLRGAGFATGDSLSVLMENSPELLTVTWGAQRIGLRYTVINHHLTSDEVQYIVDDSGAKGLVASRQLDGVVTGLRLDALKLHLTVEGTGGQPGSYEAAVAAAPGSPVAGELEGTEMLYSSGTTGRPKGVRKPLPATPLGDPGARPVQMAEASAGRYGIGTGSVYLVPAPLYHAAPLVSTMSAHRNGATVVVMERFDPRQCLALIERHRITHAQFVPTMFFRLLSLDPEERARYDLSSLQVAIHAAAPCPAEVKERMIEWWGPILFEYYAGTEDIGGTSITAAEWLRHKGSVGKANPGITIHILGPSEEELPAGMPGQIYFDGGGAFEYHNDPAKTKTITNEQGWRTLGDIGYLDGEGYLYLTDRASHMIVAGGVNIYPQESENVLTGHPAVEDVAVIGVPNPEYGEEVKAVVQLRPGAAPSPALEAELLAYCQARLAKYKCPRSVDFASALPRDPNGKLYKRRLRQQYWEGHTSTIV